MRVTILAAAAIAALGIVSAVPANAVIIPGQISTADNNDGVDDIYGTNTRQGYFGANWYLLGGPADIMVTFLGKEAGDNNSFNFGGGPVEFQNSDIGGNAWNNAGFDSQTFLGVSGGLLDFLFSNPFRGDVVNGFNPDNTDPNTVNFFSSIDDGDGTALFGQSLVVWLDDAKDVDDNHDDMAVRIEIVGGDGQIGIIPLPASVFMLLAALGGLGVVSRRRSA